MTVTFYSIPPAIGALLAFSLGCFVFSKGPRSETNRAFSGTCFSLVCWLAPYAIAYSTHDIAIAKVCTRIACTSVVLFAPFLYHFVIAYLSLSDERFYLKCVYGVMCVLLVGFTSSNLFLNGVWKYSWGFYSKAGPLHPLQILFTGVVWTRCIYLLLREVRLQQRAKDVQPETSFILFAVTIILPANVDYVQKYGVDFYPFGFIFALLYVLLTAYAIAKYRLMDLELVIQRSLIYSILAACITAIYLLVILIMERIFQGVLGYKSVIGSLVAGFVIALGFAPLRNFVQTLIDHYFFHGSQEELFHENEQLRKQVERTERLKAVATLAAGMAHEIKNPLTSIKTFAEYLPERYNDPAFRKKFAKIMSQEVDKMNALVQRLLEFAKPAPPDLGTVKVSQAVKDTLDFIQGSLVQKQIRVKTTFSEEDSIRADARQLRQVFLNVLLNSIDAMDKPGEIAVSTARQNGALRVAIKDTGRGIAAKDLQRIFDPFYTTKPSGTGLGLSVVHSIIRQHGGRINIRSQVGQGTTVQIDLPVNGGNHGT